MKLIWLNEAHPMISDHLSVRNIEISKLFTLPACASWTRMILSRHASFQNPCDSEDRYHRPGFSSRVAMP